jgi:hypothetical protein
LIGVKRSWTSAISASVLAVAGCNGAECPAGTVSVDGRCIDVDAAGPGMDASVDAFVRPDSSSDAPGLDAWEPDAPLPPDAWTPDAGTDAGPCSRCPADRPACLPDGITCVACTNDDHCTGATPACDTDLNVCVACNTATVAT